MNLLIIGESEAYPRLEKWGTTCMASAGSTLGDWKFSPQLGAKPLVGGQMAKNFGGEFITDSVEILHIPHCCVIFVFKSVYSFAGGLRCELYISRVGDGSHNVTHDLRDPLDT
jgi:hypothetical protein